MKNPDDDHVRRAFGLALRNLRLRAGYSQEELAARSSSRAHISDMERGRHMPGLDTLMHLAQLLNIPLSTLTWEIEMIYVQLTAHPDAGEVRITDMAVEDGVLVVKLRGAAEFHAGLRLYREILDRAQQEHVNRILMDCLGVSGELPDHTRQRIAIELTNYLKERQLDLKLATVGVPPTVTGYGAGVAREHGANLQVFATREAARKWLDE